ncbi:hypothetical protein M0811_09224 [Anaeramoeba ignava]|uniref:BTB domain-containing protein n=1 Tax=Anaeramoeba ignava TaxID=1746090 RepID=A0A9Q0LKV4_ANAIG|nr:hypothetical protein M0811_09224 [Anaeramoeba ignava]|eukprot:Anaeramoba_ignava/c19703_g1_i1.p1 GENE.c19703_g1_i1~~c19703_g1_i1.p1  ORF type:complete len:560 (+),score=145.81 c19703_g1_i1:39-1718(+)
MESEVFFFGQNKGFQVKENAMTPTKLTQFDEYGITQISSGDFGTLLTTTNNQVIWISRSLKDTLNHSVIQVSVGFSVAAFLTENGEVFGIGNHLGAEKNKFIPISPMISLDKNETITQIACGVYQLYLLTSKGIAYGMGDNSCKQLATEDVTKQTKPIKMMENIESIYTGNYSFSAFLLTKNDELFALGQNSSYQLGLGDDNNDIYPPQLVKTRPEGEIRQLVIGYEHSVMVVEQKGKGQAYVSGQHSYNGLGKSDSAKLFTHLSSLSNSDIIQIDVGCFHTLLLTAENEIFAYGINPYGQLGNGSFSSTDMPIKIEIPGITQELSKYRVVAGSFHSLVYLPVQKLTTIQEDFIEFLNNQEACDLTLQALDGSIGVHRLILELRIGKENIQNFQYYIKSKNLAETNSILKFIYGCRFLQKKLMRELTEIIPNLAITKKQFSEQLTKLKNANESKDFVVKFENNHFRIHKTILWARSLLFRGMFLNVNDSSNEVSNYCEISLDAFKIFLDYLYTDEIDTQIKFTKQIVEDLAKAMDYFQLNESEPNLATKALRKFEENKK